MLWVAFYRTFFFYFFLLTVLRIMGKRELGALGPLDLVVTIIMAEAAAIPIENPNRPLLLGMVPILTLFALEISLSFLCLKNDRIRHLISGRPSVVIRNGKLERAEMSRLRYSVLDLLEQLRVRGFYNLDDVEMATLESDGELSVLPKSQRRPVCAEDLGLATPPEGPVYTVVVDGAVDHKALEESGYDETWLRSQLAAQGFTNLDDVFVALLTRGRLLAQRK